MEEGGRRQGGGGPASPPTKACTSGLPAPRSWKARLWPPRIQLHTPHMCRAHAAAPKMAHPSHVSCPRCVTPPYKCRATLASPFCARI